MFSEDADILPLVNEHDYPSGNFLPMLYSALFVGFSLKSVEHVLGKIPASIGCSLKFGPMEQSNLPRL
jgi:hypothetical protein